MLLLHDQIKAREPGENDGVPTLSSKTRITWVDPILLILAILAAEVSYGIAGM